MVENPYKVLGLSEGASADEIKKAYRKKAKECHPDLHPNDPHAQEKMNEVNEAYDMLCNPEKYAARRPQGSSYGQQSQSSGYSGSYGNSGYYNAGGRSSQSSGYNQYSSYSGSSGWSTSNFNADDLFSFFFGGGMGGNVNTAPRRETYDSPDIAYAVDCINAGRYQDALSRLVRIPSTSRNARWFYLSALANNGIGNGIRAKEHIQRAVELDPNNQVYRAVYRQIANRTGAGYGYSAGNSGSYGSYGSSNSGSGSSGQSRQSSGYGYTRRKSHSLLGMLGRFIIFLLVLRFVRILFALMMSGGMYQIMR